MLAKAMCQLHMSWLTHTFREQARSHKLTEFSCQHRTAWLFCGSWLACDAGTSVHQAHPIDAIAGKPGPTYATCRACSRSATNWRVSGIKRLP